MSHEAVSSNDNNPKEPVDWSALSVREKALLLFRREALNVPLLTASRIDMLIRTGRVTNLVDFFRLYNVDATLEAAIEMARHTSRERVMLGGMGWTGFYGQHELSILTTPIYLGGGGVNWIEFKDEHNPQNDLFKRLHVAVESKDPSWKLWCVQSVKVLNGIPSTRVTAGTDILITDSVTSREALEFARAGGVVWADYEYMGACYPLLKTLCLRQVEEVA